MTRYDELCRDLTDTPKRWLVTGVAGFIGSALLERLLVLGQTVVGLDSFLTGHQENLDDVLGALSETERARFRFIKGDIRDPACCQEACKGVDYVLHEAALGSVPWSIRDPQMAHQCNVDGFVNTLLAARDAGVKRFVYASSSAVYGDHPGVPAVEQHIGRPLSPYAVTKYVDELYARIVHECYGTEVVGLRYFNVFGARQDPLGPYAAVIPKWTELLLAGAPCEIYGDGSQSRDFCHVDNVVQANLLAATAELPASAERAADAAERATDAAERATDAAERATDAAERAADRVFNVGAGKSTTLNELFEMIRDGLARHHPEVAERRPTYGDPRPGDVLHSQADIRAIVAELGFEPTRQVRDGLIDTIAWFFGRA